LRLHECATAIMARHDGQVPADLGDLLALPGIGGCTARAGAAVAFRRGAPVVATNVRRGGRRVGCGAGGGRAGGAGAGRPVRGLRLAVLREAPAPVPAARRGLVWPDAIQRTRALASLVEDGRVNALEGHRYVLPGGQRQAAREPAG